MRRCRIKSFVASNGDEIAMLLNADGVPAFWPNLYATWKLGKAGLAPKTISNILRSIGIATDWNAPRGVDFSERMMHGSPLLFEEAANLADFLALTVRSQNDWLNTERINSVSSNSPRSVPNRLANVRPSHTTIAVDPSNYLNAATAATTMRYVANYLEWIYTLRTHPTRVADFDPQQQTLAKKCLDHFRMQIPRVKGASDDDEALWALALHHCRIIEAIVLPLRDQNPWRHPFVRDRNYVVWRLFLETGGRRGEIENTKVSDFDLSKFRVTLRISKTIPRTVPYKPATSALIHEYIERHWQHRNHTLRAAG